MTVTDLEKRFLDEIRVETAWKLIELFSMKPRWRPQDVNAAADDITSALSALGIPVQVCEPDLYLSVPLEASIELDGAAIRAKAPSSSFSAPDGVSGELVHLEANRSNLRSYTRDIDGLFGGGIRTMADLSERVRGKIPVLSGFGNPALTSLIEQAGGLGLIVANPGADVHWGTCTTIWGNPGLADLARKPRIPVAAVSASDGERLMRHADETCSVVIRTTLQEGWFPQKIPVVTIPGASEPDDFILLHGHYDSWDVGVGDNATGDATLLELARVLWNNRLQLRRSVKIAWWPGHSTGRYAGSTWFADNFAQELDHHCVAQINCDSPGCRWATSYHHTSAFSECAHIATTSIRDVVPDADIGIERPHQAGDYSFNNIGLSSLYMLSSTMPDALRKEKSYYDVSGCGGNIAWHTENDTMEIADPDVLLTDMKIYLLSVLRIAMPEVLPFRWTDTVSEIKHTLRNYDQMSNGAGDFTAAHNATAKFGKLIEGVFSSDCPPIRKNRLSMDLARILVPINFTRLPRFEHDPAVTAKPLPVLSVASEISKLDGNLRHCAVTDLMRGLNRYCAAINDGIRLLESIPST